MHPSTKAYFLFVFLLLTLQPGNLLAADTVERRLTDLSQEAMTNPRRAAYAIFRMAQELETFGAAQAAEVFYVYAIDLARSRPDSKRRDNVIREATERLTDLVEQNAKRLLAPEDQKKVLSAKLYQRTAFFATETSTTPMLYREAGTIDIRRISNGRCELNYTTPYWANLTDVHLSMATRRKQSREEIRKELRSEANRYQDLVSRYAPGASSEVTRVRQSVAYVLAMTSEEGRYKALLQIAKDFPDAEFSFQMLIAAELDGALYYDAQKKGTPSGYEEYLAKYPNGRHAQEAGVVLEEARFLQVQRKDTIEAYKSYISSTPSGAHLKEAQERLEELYFRQARSVNTQNGYADFLKIYPSSRYRQDALAAIDDLDYKEAQSRDSIPVYEKYILLHPSGRNASRANTAITRLKAKDAYAQARLADTRSSYELFLHQYPNAEQANDAWAKIYLDKAFEDQTVSSFRGFFTYYGRMAFRSVSQAEWEAARNLLATLAIKRQDFEGFLVLYDECRMYGALNEAAKLVGNAAQEEEIARREPARFFQTEGGHINNERSVAYISLLSHITTNLKFLSISASLPV